jgi:hypothetical protein
MQFLFKNEHRRKTRELIHDGQTTIWNYDWICLERIRKSQSLLTQKHLLISTQLGSELCS